MIELIIANFYAVTGAILLACFVGYINWRNNFKVRFANAATDFRAAFTDALIALRNSRTDAYDILESAFPSHEAAIFEFRRFLGFKSKSFLSAWHQYACYENETEGQYLIKYSGIGQSIETRRHRRELAIKRIEKLLSYADIA